MHVAIEMNQLRLTHFHTDTRVVAGLTYLESLHLKDIYQDDTNSPTFLGNMTLMELNQLYLNTTGKELPPHFDELQRRDTIAKLFNHMLPPKVDHDELLAQIDHVLYELEADEKTGKQFKYVFGASVPAVLDGGLFPVSAPPVPAEELLESAQQAQQRRTAPAAVTVPVSAPRERSPSAVPRASGGSRPAIWAHADKVWEEAGKPMLASDVLVLRKRMMAELEEQGIKKSTSSTALGDWMKARLGGN